MISNYKPIYEPKDIVYISGKCKYARTVTPDPTYEKWSVALYPPQSEMHKVNALLEKGIRNKLKKDEEGYYITFGRPIAIKRKNGMKTPLDPPIVVDKDGKPLEEFLGDGSDVELKLETYGGPGPSGKGSYFAARLVGVKVNHLVEWTKDPPASAPPPKVKEPEPW